MGDFRNRRGEKHLRPAQSAPGRLIIFSFFLALNKEVLVPAANGVRFTKLTTVRKVTDGANLFTF